MSAELGSADLLPLVEAVIAAHPTAVNPVNEFMDCLYTDPEDPSRHCIVGQLAVEQGWPLPEPSLVAGVGAPNVSGEWPIADEGIDWLAEVQDAADVASSEGRPWSSLVLPSAEVPS